LPENVIKQHLFLTDDVDIGIGVVDLCLEIGEDGIQESAFVFV